MDRLDVPERYEQLIAFLGSNLPAPVDRQEDADGALRFTAGDPPQVVVLLTESSVIVAAFAGEWETPLTFSAKPRRVGVVKWRRLPENALLSAISALVKGARDARLASFKTCQYLRRADRAGEVTRRRHLPVVRRPAQRDDSLRCKTSTCKVRGCNERRCTVHRLSARRRQESRACEGYRRGSPPSRSPWRTAWD